MVDDIVTALLWRSRLALRAGNVRAFGGHGYVDPSYRPPAVPFASVVAPLSLMVEPEHEPGRPATGLIIVPAHLVGQARTDDMGIPATGTLQLRINRLATVTLTLTGLPATTFGNPATGPAVATAITAAIAAAVAGGQIRNDDGLAIADPAVVAAVGAVHARWSPDQRRFAIVGAAAEPSSIEIVPVSDDLSPALGMVPPAAAHAARRHLHRLPAPRPMTVETRVDLWAGNQLDLAALFDGLAASSPTRGKLLLRPSLLAGDVADGAISVRLLSAGEPTIAESLAHLEGGDGLIDRVREVPFVATPPAAAEAAQGRLRLQGAGRITGTIHRAPLIPEPFFTTDPAPQGFAVALGVRLDPGAANGDVYPLLAIRRDDATVLAIEIRVERHPVPGLGQPPLFGVIVARADFASGAQITTAEARLRVLVAPLPRDGQPLPPRRPDPRNLEDGGTIHAQVSLAGAIALWFDGAQRLDDGVAAALPAPVIGAGRPVAGTDMVVTLGGAMPHPVSITHLHVLREPLTPLDPKVRTSVSGGSRLRPGDVFAIAPSPDGWSTGDGRALSLVERVNGDVVTLSRPINGSFRRGGSVVFQDDCFFFQTALKRRDDLMNRLYHVSVDYKVSALLENPAAVTTAALVLQTREDVRTRKPTDISDRGGVPPRTAGPGTTVIEPEQSHDVH